MVAVAGGIPAAGVYAGMHALPSGFIVVQAMMRRVGGSNGDPEAWYPIGRILASLTLLAALMAVMMAIAVGGESGIEAAVRGLIDKVMVIAAPGLGDSERSRFASAVVPYFLGASAVGWLFMIILNAVLAEVLLARRGWALRPPPRWTALVIPDWMAWPLVGAATVALLASGDLSYVAHNLTVIFAAPYFFLGLAVVHQAVATTKSRGLLLAAFYFALVLFFLLAAAVVTGLGIAEQWIGVRHRLRSRSPTDRSS